MTPVSPSTPPAATFGMAEPRAMAPPFLALGLVALVVLLYADLSDALMGRFGLPSLLRPLIVVLALAVWYFRRETRPAEIALTAPVLFLSAYAFVVLSSGIWASDVLAADERLAETVRAVAIAILVGSLAWSWPRVHRALSALALTAGAMAAVSLVQVTTGRLASFGGIVSLQEGNIYSDVSLPRASGPPVNDPNFYGRILLVAIPIAICLGIADRGRGRRTPWIAVGAVIAAGTLVTYSRGAMLAMAGMAVLLAVAYRMRVTYLATLAAGALLVMMVLPSTVTRRFLTVESLLGKPQDSSGHRDTSVEKRKLLMRTGLKMFEEHPLVGVGAGNFGAHYLQYATQVGSSVIDYTPPGSRQFPHELYLETAAETGLAGLITFCGAAIATLIVGYRARRRLMRQHDRRASLATGVLIGVAGYLLASLFLHETNLRYFGLYVGLTVAISRLSRIPQTSAGAVP